MAASIRCPSFNPSTALRLEESSASSSVVAAPSATAIQVRFRRIRPAAAALSSISCCDPGRCSCRVYSALPGFSHREWISRKDFTHWSSRPSRRRMASSALSPGDDLPDEYEKDDPSKKAMPRRAGIILHPTSLPGPHGIGDLGPDAFRFLDWLESTGCRIWQVLPLVPPGRKAGEDGSPYAGQDANCGNTLLISLTELVKDGLLEEEDIPEAIPVEKINYEAVAELKDPLIQKAAKNLVQNGGSLKKDLETFRKSPQIASWLEEAALFAAIDSHLDDGAWWLWPEPLRDRNPSALDKARKEHKDFIDVFIAQQFLFQKQWQALHTYANERGIKIIGDMPIYVGGHSADVWVHRTQFMMDEKTCEPVLVSGVPPDCFSETGQLWGSPLYNWKAMAKDGYKWWASRMRRAFELYDEFRIDHFRGLAGYWAVPADAETAIDGRWKMGPRVEFFNAIKKAVGKKIDIIAEDLGIITTDVVELRKAIEAPGMVVLHFAFGNNPTNPHILHNHEVDQVVYPGTHDNDTSVGWWSKASEEDKEKARSYLRLEDEDAVSWELMRAAFSSVARTAIIPMQDVLSLDSDARMNTPAVKSGNWAWRIGESSIFDELTEEGERIRGLLHEYNRLPRSEEEHRLIEK
ncbi:4-alpha-glucanotransferase DPE1, chloroplastic/amyloplastic [Selaginella moellendorffii]|nr:4-alpha-glucanotransferase DPE1, chloroplastic/amyloplastic [Selaginella moellendorffii]|eukprot:XP_002978989.2 4-alpha-glucanotransferase DPE1, chloroplastic/amyloplastic [Selaginella moellendorffii]